MSNPHVYVGRRLSLKGQLCTAKYLGPVDGRPGEWLGVEWDDPDRGKHDGSHADVRYFNCRSLSPHAASFLRPSQPWDEPLTFLEALREKYMPDDAVADTEQVYFSTKPAEEVGFEKFARRQAQLRGIHVLVLDGMRLRATSLAEEKDQIVRICAEITELDLSRNLFESLAEILGLCCCFPRLHSLVLDGNRFSTSDEASVNYGVKFRNIRHLSLSNTLLSWSELSSVSSYFPNLETLGVSSNGLSRIDQELLPAPLSKIDMSKNYLTSLSDLSSLSSCTSLRSLILKHNQIDSSTSNGAAADSGTLLSSNITDVDLAFNQISNWSGIDNLMMTFPGLTQLRTSGNPLYQHLRSAEGRALTTEDGYMLTIARLPRLETLNYSTITSKERFNAEMYYLGQIGAELSNAPVESELDILGRHPRWRALCEEYGAPAIDRKTVVGGIDPDSLAATLITFTFEISDGELPEVLTRTWSDEIPKSCNLYYLIGRVGKTLGVTPMKLRLIWETGEQDPNDVMGDGYAGPQSWDSSEDGEEDRGGKEQGQDLVWREVELVPGSATVGSYIERSEARIRVEVRTD